MNDVEQITADVVEKFVERMKQTKYVLRPPVEEILEQFVEEGMGEFFQNGFGTFFKTPKGKVLKVNTATWPSKKVQRRRKNPNDVEYFKELRRQNPNDVEYFKELRRQNPKGFRTDKFDTQMSNLVDALTTREEFDNSLFRGELVYEQYPEVAKILATYVNTEL